MHFEGESPFGYTGAVVDDETIRGTLRDADFGTEPVELKKG